MSPPYPPDIPSALLPRELLVLAVDNEQQEMRHYRRLAFRFLPFGRGISRLLATLSIECERRLAELLLAGRELGLSPSSVDAPSAVAEQVASLGGKAAGLIGGRGQALAALQHIEARAEHAVRVALHLAEINATPALQPLLLGVVAQKQAERHILGELLEAYDDEATLDARLASRSWPRGWLAGARRLHGSPPG